MNANDLCIMSLFGNGTGEINLIPHPSPESDTQVHSHVSLPQWTPSNTAENRPDRQSPSRASSRSDAPLFSDGRSTDSCNLDYLFEDTTSGDGDGLLGQLTPPGTPISDRYASQQPIQELDRSKETERERSLSKQGDTLITEKDKDEEEQDQEDIEEEDHEMSEEAVQGDTQENDPDELGLFVSEDEGSQSSCDDPSTPDGTRYELRQHARQNQHQQSSWVDQDESGFYNPRSRFSPERLASRHPEKRKRPAPQPRSDNEPREPKAPPTLLLSRQTGYELVVTLKSEAENWFQKLDHLKRDATPLEGGRTRGEDHWLEEASNPDPLKADINTSNILDGKRFAGKHVRRDADQIDRGDPLARGCRGCIELGSGSCTLIHDGFYPCDACEDAGQSCELITEPLLKRSCETCLDGSCSFKDDRAKRGPCDRCKENDWICVAGPWEGLTSQLPRMNDTAKIHRKKRVMWETVNKEFPYQFEKIIEYQPQMAASNPTTRINSEAPERPISSKRKRSNTDGAEKQRRRKPKSKISSNTPTRTNSEPPEERPDSPGRKKQKTQGEGEQQKRKPQEQKDGASIDSQLPHRPGYTRHTKPHRQHIHAGQDINKWVSGPACIRIQEFFQAESSGDDDDDSEELTQEVDHRSSLSSEPALSRYLMSGALPPPPKKIGEPQWIRTTLAHPVTINHDVLFQCDWCSPDTEKQFKTIIGSGERQIYVQETEDGYLVEDETERDNSALCTKMCSKNTLERFLVASCEHQWGRITNATAAPFQEIMMRILNPSLGRIPVCSICPKAALYQCEKYGQRQTTQVALGQTVDDGCGLLCCSDCMKGLDKFGDSVVDFVKDKMDSLEMDSVGEIRADAELFGHVSRRFQAQSLDDNDVQVS